MRSNDIILFINLLLPSRITPALRVSFPTSRRKGLLFNRGGFMQKIVRVGRVVQVYEKVDGQWILIRVTC